MLPQFPKADDQYPMVYLKDTDLELPSSASNINNTRYTHFKTLARGGKCLIKACKDNYLSRVVCYKELRPEFADDPHEQKRFLREARVTAMLQHPNTIPIYELSRNNKGHYYFTMKRAEGLTLREILDLLRKDQSETGDEWPLDRLVEVVIQVGHVLNYAHTHGVVHRDVKPANILVGNFGEVVLLDWGLAKVWKMEVDDVVRPPLAEEIDQSLTQMGGAQATPLYMSPEQVAESQEIDHRTDVYSLGAVLYECLTLEYMAWGNTMDELLAHTQFEPPPPPREKAPQREIPAAVESVCLRCVEKDPAARIQTMAQVIRELTQWRSRTQDS